MKKIDYHIFWPAGNTTALVETLLPRDKYSVIAQHILDKNKEIEQVGFIESPTLHGSKVRLQMAGGEFCGNAARSIAYWYSQKYQQPIVNFEVSGLDKVLLANITSDLVELFLPKEFFLSASAIPEGIIVNLRGITHIIIDKPLNDPSVNDLLNKYKNNYDALGIMSYKIENDEIVLDPLVFVRSINTYYNESACGSGTVALALAINTFFSKQKPVVAVRQPSGEYLTVFFHKNSSDQYLLCLSGKVKYFGIKLLK